MQRTRNSPPPPSFSTSPFAAKPLAVRAPPPSPRAKPPPQPPAPAPQSAVATGCAIAGWVLALAVVALVVWLIVVLMKQPDGSCNLNTTNNPPGGDSASAMVGNVSPVAEATSLAELKRIAEKNETVLTMVHAPWCVHCKAAKPHFEKGAAAAGKGVKGVLVNGDAAKDVLAEYGVNGFPTYLLHKHGKHVPAFEVSDRKDPFKGVA